MKQLSLESLSKEINDLFDYSEHHKEQAVIYAARCGDKLNMAKAQCKHGEWTTWVQANCRVNRAQVSNYMKLAIEYPELTDPNYHSSGNLPGIITMLSLLDAPDEVKTQADAELAAGNVVTKKDVDAWKLKAEKANEDKDKVQEKLDCVSGDLLNNQHNMADLVREATAEQMKRYDLEVENLASERDTLRKQLAGNKKSHDKDVADGVCKALRPQQDEINRKEYHLQVLEKDIAELEEAKKKLSKGYSSIVSHQEHVKKINDAFQTIAMEMYDAADDGEIPEEMQLEWDKILENAGDCQGVIRRYMGLDNKEISYGG